MCTWIVQTAKLNGSGKAASGWIPVTKANVCYDHPAHAFMEHSLNIDFVNEGRGAGRAGCRGDQRGVGAGAGERDSRRAGRGGQGARGPVGGCARVVCAFAGITRGRGVTGVGCAIEIKVPAFAGMTEGQRE